MKTNTKAIVVLALACACALDVSAQYRRSTGRGAATGGRTTREAEQEKMDAKVKISQMPSIGPQSLIVAPQIQAQGGAGRQSADHQEPSPVGRL